MDRSSTLLFSVFWGVQEELGLDERELDLPGLKRGELDVRTGEKGGLNGEDHSGRHPTSDSRNNSKRGLLGE